MRPGLTIAALLALACLPYVNTLTNGFVLDDGFVYSQNSAIRSLANLRYLFDDRYFAYSGEASYRPVCTASYFLDWALWKQWVGGPHLGNIVLYGLTVWLLFLLYEQLTRSRTAAFLGAALFAVHPIHTEVVANIGFREDLLVPLFLVGSWLAFRQGAGSRAGLWLPVAWVLYFLALLSKESAIVFPLLAVALRCVDRPQSPSAGDGRLQNAGSAWYRRPFVWYLAGLGVCTVLFILIRFHWLQCAGEANQPRLGGTLLGTLLADVRIQARYLVLILTPARLLCYYPASQYSPQWDWTMAVSLTALLGLAVLFWVFRRARWFVFAWVWWFVCLAPVSNVYPIFNPMAERYLFLPSVGFCLWAGWALAKAFATRYRLPAALATGAFLVAMATLVVLRNPVWHDNLAVWQSVARVTPDDPTVLSNLAEAYYETQEYDKVTEFGQRALAAAREQSAGRFNPVGTYVALGCASFARHERDQALEWFRRAEAGLPCRFDIDAAVYENLALVYQEKGRNDLAARYIRKATELNPFRADLWFRLAYNELRAAGPEAARAAWERAHRLDPKVPAFAALEATVRGERSAASTP